MSEDRAENWLLTAREDLRIAVILFDASVPHGAAFHAQQAGEKALKAANFKQGQHAFGHSCLTLAQSCGAPDHIIAKAKQLDRHYIPSRYPDAYPTGTPMDFYLDEEAKLAIEAAKTILAWVEVQP